MITVPTLFRQPKDAQDAGRQIRIVERAERLHEDGYRLIQRTRKTLFGIFKPENQDDRHADYVVSLQPGHHICSCKGFKEDGDCKHRIACAQLADDEAAFEAAYEEWGGDERARHEGLL